MKEEFLYYLWGHKLIANYDLITTTKEQISIVKTGLRNTNEGPDFLEAQIKIGNKLWVGHVEMHVKASDWYLHKHEEDINYDPVILHVVWEKDAAIYTKTNEEIPTLELQHFISKDLVNTYKSLMQSKKKWIPCQDSIGQIDPFIVSNWKERLFFERLENKANHIQASLEASQNNYEAILVSYIAKYFGTKTNADAFYNLLQSFDFCIVKKVRFDLKQIEAILFGQSGLLNNTHEEPYFNELKTEYEYLSYKFNLQPMLGNQFQFFRMRPTNFPTIRLAQLAALLYKHQHLFSELIKIDSLQDFYTFFKLETSSFWDTHFTFSSTSKWSKKQLTKAFIDILIINAILPLKLVYLKNQGKPFQEEILFISQQLKSEKNSIITNYSKLGLASNNAMDSQALIELKNNYCTKKQCLHCAIGLQIIKS